MSVKTFQINGQDVSGRQEESILDIARENDIYIPTLCNIDGLTPIGACRLCIVEVAGSNKLLPACATKVQEGMEVFTDTERLLTYRRTLIEMLFVEGNHVCAVCVSNGHCELQSMAEYLGVDHTSLDYRYPDKGIDISHYRYGIDHNRCILCSRCVRVCGEIEGAHTWNVSGRGIDAQVVTDLNGLWAESPTCTECGKCIQVCPTGALFKKSRAIGEMEKDKEFLPYLKTMREVDNGK
jgi:bidirectional [NiFe] hydrogenase diaphorase subunit